jgi:predicted nucleic acid-binding protein
LRLKNDYEQETENWCRHLCLWGCFDDEFKRESLQLFKDVTAGKFIVVVSDTTFKELDDAPEKVQNVLENLPKEQVEYVSQTDEVYELRDAYLDAGVVGPKSRQDAEHIATASAHNVDFVVSWNFKHIVHYDKISGYHAVNVLKGYMPIKIYSHKEVASNEEDVWMCWNEATIQKKQMEEFAGLSDQERIAQIQREIRQNKKFAKFLSKTPSSQTETHWFFFSCRWKSLFG